MSEHIGFLHYLKMIENMIYPISVKIWYVEYIIIAIALFH